MSEALIVRNVTVIDGSGGPAAPGSEVLIEDGVFRAIRPSGSGDPGVPVFDGKGGYLLPGLWESHTHLRARPEEAPPDQIARLDGILAEYLRAGITSVLELGGPLDIDVSLRQRYSTTPATASADLFFAGPSFTGIDGWPLGLHHNHALVREAGDAETARRMCREIIEGGVDFIKVIYDGEPGAPDKLPREALEAVVATARELGKHVVVHICTSRDIREAVEAGANGIEHTFIPADPDDVGEAEDIAGLLARTGTYFCPTLTVFEQIGRSGDRAYLQALVHDEIISQSYADAVAKRPTFGEPFPHHPAEETLLRYTYGMRTLPIYRDAGVKIAAGSDVAFFMARPAALHRELQLLALAGLSCSQVIVAATRHAAEKIGKGATIGTIAPGMIADALLVDADPLADVMSLVRAGHRVAAIRAGQLHAAVVA